MTMEIPHEPDKPRAAFFDLEKTLSRVAVEQDAAIAFYRQGELGLTDLARVAWSYLRYNLGFIKDFDEMKGFGAKVFTGRSPEHDRAAYRAYFDETLIHTISEPTRPVLDGFRAAHVDLYIISSTYGFMVEPFAEHIGALGYYGASLEVVEGRCTGRLTGPLYHQQTKADVVHQLAQTHGYLLSHCWAFGDSINDREMLEAVGRPHAVTPSSELRGVATESGWPILDW